MLDDKNLSKNYFTDITYDILFINFTDDTYAPYKNSLKLSSFYSTSNLVFKHIHPKEFNFNTIGHFGFFKKKYKDTLWSLLNL
jgi:predicted alpha/beta hydrolase